MTGPTGPIGPQGPAGSGGGVPGVTGPSLSTPNAVVRWDGVSGYVLKDSGIVIDDSNNMIGARTIQFGLEFQNPTGGMTMTVNWRNGQKQFLPVGTNTTVNFVNPSGPGNYLLRVYHYQANSRLFFPTGVASGVRWQGGTLPTGTVTVDSTDFISVYFDGSKYYGMGSSDFR